MNGSAFNANGKSGNSGVVAGILQKWIRVTVNQFWYIM